MYDSVNQGFSATPGGVAYQSELALPAVTVSDSMRPNVPNIAIALYQNMINRNTVYSNYIASVYSKNGYNNSAFATAIEMAAGYADYLVDTQNVRFADVFNQVIDTANDWYVPIHIEMLMRQNIRPPITMTPVEATRYETGRTRYLTLKDKIKENLERKNNMNYPQQMYNQQPMAMPATQGAAQFQQKLAQRQHNHQAAQQQAMMNQWMAQQQAMVQPTWAPQMNTMQQPMMQAPQQMFNTGYQTMQPQFVNQQAAMGTMTPIQQTIMAQQMQQQAMMQNPQMFNNAFMTAQQQAPQLMQQFGNTTCQPTKPGEFASSDPFALAPNGARVPNSVNMPVQPQTNNPFQGSQMHQPSSPQTTNKPITNNVLKPIIPQGQVMTQEVYAPTKSDDPKKDYENRLRAHAQSLGLPHDAASLDFLEDNIRRLDPRNSEYISPRNAYATTRNTAVQTTPGRVSQPTEEVYGIAHDVQVQHGVSFADVVKQQAQPQPSGELVFDYDGRASYQMATQTETYALTQHAEVINTVTNDSPYDFAYKDVDDNWAIAYQDYHKVPKNKRGVYIHPAGFIGEGYKPYYIVNDEGKIIKFLTIKENDMDYDRHSAYKSFFTATTTLDASALPSEKETLKAFAVLQQEQRIAEVLKDLEDEAGVISPDKQAVIANQTIQLEEAYRGALEGDDYWLHAHDGIKKEFGDVDFDFVNSAIRYKHVHMLPWTLSDEAAQAALKLRHKQSYAELVEVFEQLEVTDDFHASYMTKLNSLAVNYVNNVLRTQFNITEWKIQSFVLDVLDAQEELAKMGLEEEFVKTARKLSSTLLYAFTPENDIFKEYFGFEKDEDKVGFGVIRDVTLLPIMSRELALKGENDVVVITKEGYRSLWEIASKRLAERNPRVAEILFVTLDNRALYINPTSNEDIIIATTNSVVEKTTLG